MLFFCLFWAVTAGPGWLAKDMMKQFSREKPKPGISGLSLIGALYLTSPACWGTARATGVHWSHPSPSWVRRKPFRTKRVFKKRIPSPFFFCVTLFFLLLFLLFWSAAETQLEKNGIKVCNILKKNSYLVSDIRRDWESKNWWKSLSEPRDPVWLVLFRLVWPAVGKNEVREELISPDRKASGSVRLYRP